MTIDDHIKYLNDTVLCTLKPSSIHGIGVFALKDIKKDDNLYCTASESPMWYKLPLNRLKDLRPEVLALILDRWPQITEGRPFKSPNDDANLMSFMNHSDSPNSCEGLAIRDIKAGEEITEDYNTGNLSELQKEHYRFLK